MRLSVVKRNVVSNVIGSGMVALLTILITPLQVNILGIEAYGIVGFIATLQVVFSAFDLGLSSTLTRELATDLSPEKRRSVDLLKTAIVIYWGSAVVAGLLIGLFAPWIAVNWFSGAKTDTDLLIRSLQVIALYLAMRWPVSLYVGVLSGLQRMEILNLIKIGIVLIRLVGGIVVLMYWRTLNAFLYWTAFSALLEVAAYAVTCHKLYPAMSIRPGFSVEALRRVWRFSVSMNTLAILGIFIVQLDRLMLSKMGSLEHLGYYNLAYTAASGLVLVIGSINAAVFPWFAEVHGAADKSALVRRYGDASFAMMLVVTLGAVALVFYAHDLITLWVNKEAADGTELLVIFLVLGFWVSAAITNVYNVAIASGRPQRHLKVNIISIVPYVIGQYLLIRYFAATGAAIGWFLLNVGYSIFLLPFVHRNIIGIGVWGWLKTSVGLPVTLALAAFVPIKLALLLLDAKPYENLLGMLASVAFYAVIGYVVLRRGGHLGLASLRLGSRSTGTVLEKAHDESDP